MGSFEYCLDSFWHNVDVPHTWNVVDDFYDYIGEAWYRLELFPEDDLVDTLILRLEAVYYRADKWLIGEYLGEHEGGYTPFEFDVRGLVEAQTVNSVAVRVENYRRFDLIPDDTFDWWPCGGIVREVAFRKANEVYLEKQHGVADPHITGWNQADIAEPRTAASITNSADQDFQGKSLTDVLVEGTGS